MLCRESVLFDGRTVMRSSLLLVQGLQLTSATVPFLTWTVRGGGGSGAAVVGWMAQLHGGHESASPSRLLLLGLELAGLAANLVQHLANSNHEAGAMASASGSIGLAYIDVIN